MGAGHQRPRGPDVAANRTHTIDWTWRAPDRDDAAGAGRQRQTPGIPTDGVSERRIDGGATRFDSTRAVRDVNGEWQEVETRRGEARASGPSERTEEETVQRRDVNGNTVMDQRIYTRRTTANGRDVEVIEVYAPPTDQKGRSDSRLALGQRIQRTTSATPDGSRQTVEEVEERNSVAPNQPMRVTRRTVTTVRQTGSGRTVTEREFFERELNGSIRLVRTETEERGN